MTAAEQDWVQQSLARLEQLEQQRVHLEASGQIDRLAEIDEEIASLYEVLESVAEDSESQAPANPAVAAVPAAAPAPMMAAPAPTSLPALDNPFGPPPAAPAQPGMGVAAPAAAMAAPLPDPSYASYDDDFDAPKSKTGLIVGILAVLVIGGGAAAFFVMQQGGEKEKTAEQPTDKEPGKVLKAGEIPDDTSEPKVAEGADADRSRGTEFKTSPGGGASSTPARGSSTKTNNTRGGGGKKNTKKGDDRSIKVGSSNDPLAGVN